LVSELTQIAGLSQWPTFRQRLLAARSLGKDLLAFGDGLAAETDSLLRVEHGTFPDQALDTAGTTVNLIKSDLINDLGAMLPV
jgi:hypothetical protein